MPYGEKSRETIVRYALSSAAFLVEQGAQLLVVACNTASALALPELQAALPIPVLGVIEPGTQAAAAAGREGQVLVLATTATVRSHAYAASLAALGLSTFEKACPLLVPLVEEGWVDHPVTAEVLRIYLSEVLAEAAEASTLVLGCTHYPLLRPTIEQTLAAMNHPLHIVDSAQATAESAARLLPPATSDEPTRCTFYATDSIEKFQRLGSVFLGQPLPHVHLIDLGG